jgi:hypothetical protein
VLPDQYECAQSHLRCDRSYSGLQGSCGAYLSNGTRVRADVVFTLDHGLLSLSAYALEHVMLRLKRSCTRLQVVCAQSL